MKLIECKVGQYVGTLAACRGVVQECYGSITHIDKAQDRILVTTRDSGYWVRHADQLRLVSAEPPVNPADKSSSIVPRVIVVLVWSAAAGFAVYGGSLLIAEQAPWWVIGMLGFIFGWQVKSLWNYWKEVRTVNKKPTVWTNVRTVAIMLFVAFLIFVCVA